MKPVNELWRCAARAVFVSTIMMTAASQAHSQQVASIKKARATPTPSESQIQASAILRHMAEFLSATQRFSVSVHAGYDAVQDSGQKIEFGESRNVTLSRPDRLRVEGEHSDGTKVLTVFSGKEIMLIDGSSNVYATTPQPGDLDQSIVYFVRDLGMRLPLAVLLLSQLPTELNDRVRSVDYVEKTSIRGIVSHHLAARTDTVDFQIWVADGEQPLPQRVVISYKKARGEPQFWADLSEWNLAPAISDATFDAKPPENAQRVAFAAQLAGVSRAVRKSSTDKGGK